MIMRLFYFILFYLLDWFQFECDLHSTNLKVKELKMQIRNIVLTQVIKQVPGNYVLTTDITSTYVKHTAAANPERLLTLGWTYYCGY